MDKIKFALLTETAKIPTRKHSTDAGIDLYADLGIYKSLLIASNNYEIVATGVTVEIPKGYFGWITNKGKSDYLIGGGIVDEGYQGELLVKIINPLDEPVYINHNQAIAQLLIIPCKILDIEIAKLSEIHQKKSERQGNGGIVSQMEFERLREY